MTEKLRRTGIGIIGDVLWGTHFCLFYQSKKDLTEILVPYFKAGLENNEYCMWVTSETISKEEAEEALVVAAPNFWHYVKNGQIEIIPHTQWYVKHGIFDLQSVLDAWLDKLNKVLSRGYNGIRVTGDTAWLKKETWRSFIDYEHEVNKTISKHQAIAVCTYCLDKCGASEVMDVANAHQFTVVRREGKWAVVESDEHKWTQEALKIKDSAVASSINGIALSDLQGSLTYVNDSFLKMWGYEDEKQVLGKPALEFWHSKESASKVVKALRHEGSWIGELTATRRNGSTFEVQLSASMVVDEGDRPLCMMASFVDVTERKHAEERQAELLRQLESSNRELRDFARVVSHDLKAPLRAIATLARRISTVHADEVDEDGGERVDLLLRQVNRMHELIDGVLKYAMVGSVKNKQVQVDINNLVPEIIDMVAPLNNIAVMVENKLPVVECEPIHIIQVFQNLLDNAVRFVDKSMGRIRIGCAEDNGFWKFSVADNGPGIEQEYFDRMFQLFWTSSFHNEAKSTGIGLSVVKRIVQMYGGKIWVESKVGVGSTFFFTWPITHGVVEDSKAVLTSSC